MGSKGSCQRLDSFPDNIGPFLSIDETALTNGELYTIITNKAGKGRKGTLVAMVEGTGSDKNHQSAEYDKRESSQKGKGGYPGYGRINEEDSTQMLS